MGIDPHHEHDVSGYSLEETYGPPSMGPEKYVVPGQATSYHGHQEQGYTLQDPGYQLQDPGYGAAPPRIHAI